MDHTHNQNNTPTVPDEILHPNSRFLFRYWEQLRGEESAPTREKINLPALRPVVTNLCIMERKPESQSYGWRLAGAKVCKLWGRELTNHDVFENWPNFERETLARTLDGVVGSLQPAVVRIRLSYNDREPIGCEFLALPLRIEKLPLVRVLGAFSAFNASEWLKESYPVKIELTSLRNIWIEHLPNDNLVAMSRRPEKTTPNVRSFLRVIDGGLD